MDQAPDVAKDQPTKETLAFKATRWPFAKLLLTNTLLNLITLGIYRFWAKTKIRRFLWHHVRFLGDPLEYTGTGGELFVGFLIVVAILFPLGLIYKAIGAVVPPENQTLQFSLEAVYYVVLFALLQIGFYRMWRYRMSRTTWRGVRFGLDGSTWSYLKLASGWTVLSVITLGAAYPWMKIDLWRYQIRHTRLGDQVFRFEGDAKSLFLAWLPVLICILVVAGVGVAGMMMFGFDARLNYRAMAKDQQMVILSMLGSTVVAYIIGAFAFFYYRVRQARLQISGLRLADARFHSTLRFARLLGFALLGVFLIIVMFAAASGISASVMLPHSSIIATGASPAMGPFFIILWIIGFFTFLVIAPFIWSVVFSFELVRQTTITTTIYNPGVLELAAQSAPSGPRTGEGLADALDIGGF